MNLLLIGSAGILSSTIYHHLLTTEHTLCAVAIYKRRHRKLQPVIATETHDLELLALQAGIRVIELQDEAEACRLITDSDIDVSIMACYARRLPRSIIDAARQGCFNVHPSLLPKYRGPEPLFWQFKYSAEFGVSLHRVTQQFDAGAVFKQQSVELDDGCGYSSANKNVSSAARPLLDELLTAIEEDRLKEIEQDESKASYFPMPTAADFSIDSGWSARHVYNFVSGTKNFGHPYHLASGDTEVVIEDVVRYSEKPPPESVTEQGQIVIPCRDGSVIARLV